MKTYIIKTKSGEYYCGKSKDVDKRFSEHMSENKPHWFAFKDRKNIGSIIEISGDYEKQIKRAGVKLIYNLLTNSTIKHIGGAS